MFLLYVRYIMFFVLVVFGLLLLFKFVFGRRMLINKRLSDIQKQNVSFDEVAVLSSKSKLDSYFESSRFYNLPIIGSYYKKNILLLKENNSKIKPKEYVLLSILIPVILFGVTFVVFFNIFISFGVAFIGSWCPNVYRVYVRNKRQVKIDQQLPNILSVLSNGLRAGLSINQALAVSLNEMEDPLHWEFQRVLQDINLGRSFDRSLSDMSERVKNENVTIFTTVVIIQRQIGGNLSEILDLVSQNIREKLAMKRKIKTLVAQNKLSAVIISALPIVIAGAISIIRPDYLKPLYTDIFGKIAIGGSVIMMIVGVVILKKLTDLEV